MYCDADGAFAAHQQRNFRGWIEGVGVILIDGKRAGDVPLAYSRQRDREDPLPLRVRHGGPKLNSAPVNNLY